MVDTKELRRFQKELLNIATKEMPKESKQFMRKEGLKLKQLTLRVAKSKVKKIKGTYFKSIKRGKVYNYNGAMAIRAYSYAPHAHLIEDGHRQIGKDGEEVGFTEGKEVFKTASKNFEGEYLSDVKDFVTYLIDKGLS